MHQELNQLINALRSRSRRGQEIFEKISLLNLETIKFKQEDFLIILCSTKDPVKYQICKIIASRCIIVGKNEKVFNRIKAYFNRLIYHDVELTTELLELI